MSRRDAEVANGSDLSNVKLDAAIDSVAQKIINSTAEGGRICWIHGSWNPSSLFVVLDVSVARG
jgi:hypothetical protein